MHLLDKEPNWVVRTWDGNTNSWKSLAHMWEECTEATWVRYQTECLILVNCWIYIDKEPNWMGKICDGNTNSWKSWAHMRVYRGYMSEVQNWMSNIGQWLDKITMLHQLTNYLWAVESWLVLMLQTRARKLRCYFSRTNLLKFIHRLYNMLVQEDHFLDFEQYLHILFTAAD